MEKSKGNKGKNTTLAQRLHDCNEVVMTLDDAGLFLGKTREAVKKMCQRGKIPAHKNGKTWYILKSEVVESLRNL